MADECVCAGNQLQLTCQTVGDGSTVWTGTAFPNGCRDLTLRHNLFSGSEGVTRFCPGMVNIVASSVSVDGSCYTSQLTIALSSKLNGTSVVCEYDNGSDIFLVGEYPVILSSGEEL